jgi:hypothetical protein
VGVWVPESIDSELMVEYLLEVVVSERGRRG